MGPLQCGPVSTHVGLAYLFVADRALLQDERCYVFFSVFSFSLSI